MFFAISMALAGSAVAADESCLVSFSSATQDVCTGKAGTTGAAFDELVDANLVKDSNLRLIKFSGPISPQQRAAVEQAGATILGYAPHYAYIVRMAPALDNAAKQIDGVNWVGPFLPAFKVDANIAQELKFENIVNKADITELAVSVAGNTSQARMQNAISAIRGLSYVRSVNTAGETVMHVAFDKSQLAYAVSALALDENVLSIGFRWPKHLVNSQADWLHQSNVSTPTPLRPVFAKGLYGCGQIVGELDTGLYADNVAFKDTVHAFPTVSKCDTGASCPSTAADLTQRKVISYYKWSNDAGTSWADEHGHGTHTAGSILGQNPATPVDCANFTTEGGNTDLDGTAPGARIVFQESGSDLRYLNTQGGTPFHAADIAYTNGARLHSNSWGGGCVDQFGQCISGCSVTYDDTARSADLVNATHPDMLMVFAAGNDATDCGVSSGNNVGSPGNSKNVLTVGATLRGTSANGMAGFSSRGPTYDRRTKPDVSAQGNGIISADRSASGTLSMSGTSMATPTTSGLAALVREYLNRGFYPSGTKTPADAIANPSAALIKAIMINGAFKMTGSGAGVYPGQDQGWGRVLLDDSLYFNGDSSHLYLHDAPAGLQTNGVDVHTLDVTAGQPLRVTLTWSDPAAAVGANPATVNQLRLEVQAPNGDVWTQKLPASGGLASPNPLQDITTANYDTVNTVQRILLAAPAAGTYVIRVKGINVPTGPQKYALAATGAFTVNVTPDFALSSTPGSTAICAGSPASYSIGVQSLSGYTTPVNLSITGVPGSATSTFTPATVTPASPPNTSALAINNTAGVASGNYSMVVTGTSGALTHTTGLQLGVTAAVPTAGSLTAPANGAANQSSTPVFTWATNPNAAQYRFQLSTSPAFASFVENQLVSATTFTPVTALSPNTTYYWRVIGVNACGDGAASTVFSFTTANVICRSPNLAIPDNNATGVTDTLTVADTSTLTGMKLIVKANHTWVGDLAFTLSKTGGSSVIVIDRPGVPASTNGCSGDNIDVTLDDAAATLVESQCNAAAPALSGSVKPNNAINTAFSGATLNGNWTLKVTDSAGSDTGTLTQWCLVPSVAAPTTFTVGGSVGGLTSSGLVLSLNAGAQTLPVSSGASSFTFPTGLANGAAYAVTVGTQPAGQTCSVTNGSGTISGANVTNVSVTCVTPTFTIGGSVGGLTSSGLVLSLNAGAQTLPVSSGASSFTFPTGLANGAAYAVTVGTQPSGQTCSVSNGSGTVSGANVTTVSVTCTTPTYTIGGSVGGLTGSGLVLSLNAGAQTLPVSSGATSFTFPTGLANSAAYAVTVATQPTSPKQVCSVASGSGTVAGANVTNIAVTCKKTHKVGGTVTGLIGGASGLVLKLNGVDTLPANNGSFQFPTELLDGENYTVTVGTQPTGQIGVCTVSNDNGTVTSGMSDVGDVTVSCNTDRIFYDGFEG